jgi:hypothetical protein
MASLWLTLPRLTCHLKGKKGVNHHASPYRLKNYAHSSMCSLFEIYKGDQMTVSALSESFQYILGLIKRTVM